MARKRRQFTAGFKARMALRERDSVQAIAAWHELHPNQVNTWEWQPLNRPSVIPALDEDKTLQQLGVEVLEMLFASRSSR